MTLIKCPECRLLISSDSESCSRCGYPLYGGGTTQAHAGRVQTVEKTSKRYKLQQILAFVLLVAGLIAIIGGAVEKEPGVTGYGFLMGVVGFIWTIWCRFMIWWHHG